VTCGENIVLLAVLPTISSSNFPGPDSMIVVLSVLLPTMSKTVDPEPSNASVLKDNISDKNNMIDGLNFIPATPYLILNRYLISI